MKFSIITISFNSEAFIADALRSVAAQDFPDFEHIIIDGGSADGTLDVVERNGHPRLRIFSEPDKGIYDAMNKGLKHASGEYVGFVNSDDFLASKNALSLVAGAAARTGADCVFADTLFTHGSGARYWTRLYSARRFRPWWLRLGIMPPHPSMFVRRKLLLRLGGFDTTFRIAGDFDLIARAILAAGASWTSLPVVTTRFRTGGVSTAGLKAKQTIGREMARSLRSLRQPWPELAVSLRFLFKLAQFRRTRSDKLWSSID